MKQMKRILALTLALLLCLAVLAGCGEGEQASSEADYKVTVVDAMGNPFSSGYAVKFMQNGQQVAMQIPNDKGESVKTLAKGDYTVELQFTGNASAYYFDSSDLTLSADKTELTIELMYAMPSESRELAVGGGTAQAYMVNVGCTQVTLDSEKRSYFLFAPTEAGLYEFTVLNSDAAIGYYGAPHFVQERSAADVIDNKFTISVRADSLGGEADSLVLVIGVDASATDGVLSITRLGDPEWTVADEPWTVYRTTAQITEFDLPAGTVLKDFDLTAATDAYTLVYNETDGYYHLDTADGPLVLVRLGKNAEKRYIDPLGRIIERSSVVKYFYDENGDFLRKESYTECLYDYCAGEDADGNGEVEYYYYLDDDTETYPLTEDLKYIIQQRGDYSGWWDPDSSMYLFIDGDGLKLPGINSEIAWLFMCCYVA